MRFSFDWLKDHLETTASLAEVTTTLTALGLEVEAVEDPAQGLDDLVVGEIIAVAPHPNADRLRLCSVEAGGGPVQVVCGAPNVRVGLKSIFAAPGSRLPVDGHVLKASVIRGVESQGMLCSAREIGLGDDHEGILELDGDPRPGMAASQALPGCAQPVIEIALTPNRPDCTGVRGIARDLAAAGLGTLKPLPSFQTAQQHMGGFACPVSVRLDCADACPEFQIRLIRGVKNGPSPDWLQERLLAAGLRPISALVDVTNYLTIDQARPLHVFDAARVVGDLNVRAAFDGETLNALDGHMYRLTAGMTVITDQNTVLSLGGVIGGQDSCCGLETTDVLLECASFDPARTAATGRALHLETHARYRFERGVDPASVAPGMAVATAMIMELCGGEASDLHCAGTVPDWRHEVAFRPGRVADLGGVDLPAARCRSILQSLGFEIKDTEGDDASQSWQVSPPSWRGDVAGEADIVEEVLRVHGFDAIPAVAMDHGGRLPGPVRDPVHGRPGRIARALAVRGLMETVNWSFMESGQSLLFGGGDDALRLLNPISQNLDQLRPTPLASLAVAVSRNLARGQSDFGLFEIGPAFTGGQPGQQRIVVAGLRAGNMIGRHWSGPVRPVDAFAVKADILAALEAAGVASDRIQTQVRAPDWFHPGQSGCLRLGPKNILAQFGMLHPLVAKAFDLNVCVAGFEIFMDALPEPKKKLSKARPPLDVSAYQPVMRDFSFLVDASIPAADLVAAARKGGKKLVDRVEIFDIYDGQGVPEGKKSVAVTVRLQPRQGTLTDAMIEDIAACVAAEVAEATGAVLRAG